MLTITNTTLDPHVNMTVSSYKLDTLQKYLERASSQPQLKTGIIYTQALPYVNH